MKAATGKTNRSTNNLLIGQRVGVCLDHQGKYRKTPIYAHSEIFHPKVLYGVVQAKVSSDYVKVWWDNKDYNDLVINPQTQETKGSVPVEVDVSFLWKEEELKSKYTSLEKEYFEYAAQISQKLKQACDTLKEANELAKKLDMSLSDFDRQNCGFFADTSREIGYIDWSHSTANC